MASTPSRHPDLEHLRVKVSPEVYKATQEALKNGHIKGQDAAWLLEQVATGELDERLVIRALSIAATIKDAQWIAHRLEEGGVDLLLKFPSKKLYAAYLAGLKSSSYTKPPAFGGVGFTDNQLGRQQPSNDSDGPWRKIEGIKPLSSLGEETQEQNSVEIALTECASATEDKKKREKIEESLVQDYKKVALKVAEQITACNEVDNVVANPIQTDFIADTPGEDVISVQKYKQQVAAAKAARAKLSKEHSNNKLV